MELALDQLRAAELAARMIQLSRGNQLVAELAPINGVEPKSRG
jgi:hypothetical protein